MKISFASISHNIISTIKFKKRFQTNHIAYCSGRNKIDIDKIRYTRYKSDKVHNTLIVSRKYIKAFIVLNLT